MAEIKDEDIEFSPSTHAECVFNTHTYVIVIDTKIPIDVDNYFKIPPEALELKKYILQCQDRKIFCEVSKELIDYAIGYGTIRLSKLPENEKIIKEITEYAEQLRYSKPTISWQLREFLGLNKND